MDPDDWLALILFFTASYTQLFIFYTHAYGVEGGWTYILQTSNEKIRRMGIPGFLFFIYFTICDSLKATAAFLAWKAMDDVFGTEAYDNTTMDVVGASFFIGIVLCICWTKSFFTPPKPYFVAAVIFSILEFCMAVIAAAFYYNVGTNKIGLIRVGDEKRTPFVLQVVYIGAYSLMMTLYSLYGFFNSEEPARSGSRT